MPRQGDKPEDYQIQSTYRPRPPQEDMVVRVGKALKASWDRSVDETKHGRVLKFASLDEAVVALSKEGFEIVFKDAVACQMRQAKRANGLAVVGLAILTGGLSLIPDVLQRGGKKDNMILLRLDAEGRVRLVKTKKRYVPPLESGSDRLPSPPGSSSTDQTT